MHPYSKWNLFKSKWAHLEQGEHAQYTKSPNGTADMGFDWCQENSNLP